MKLSSTTFEDNGQIPRNQGYKNGNQRPPLAISGVPSGAASLAIIMDDPDAVAAVGKTWVHWTVWNIAPTTAEIGSVLPPGCVEGVTDFGDSGYGGPAPPDREHVYVFTVYALDTVLDLGAGSARSELDSAIKDHVMDTAVLHGRYAP